MQSIYMSLRCLVIGDVTTNREKTCRLLEAGRTEFVWIESDGVRTEVLFPLLPYDLIIIAIQTLDQAIFISEEISRLSPTLTTVFLFESSSNFSYLFGLTMERMVNWMISYDNIDSLSKIISDIFNAKYRIVKRITSDIIFTERELSIVRLIQMDLSSEDIQSKLSMSERTFIRDIADLGIKMECNGRGSIGVRSFSLIGDLRI